MHLNVHVDNRFFAGTVVFNETLSLGAFLFLGDGTDQANLEGTPLSATCFRPFIEVLISSRLKCSEHTFISHVIIHCFPSSRRIAWIPCSLLTGDFGKAKNDRLSPVDDFTPFWWHLGTQQHAGIVKTSLKLRQELGSRWYWYVLQKNWGPTSLDFAQLAPGCPIGLPYLHLVYCSIVQENK